MAARGDLFHPDYKPEPYWWEAAPPGTEFSPGLPKRTEVLAGGGYYRWLDRRGRARG